ncbi:MAG: WG repeat-containing protein [Pyrinomonadaceae bacterium]|nr:WG repeat-containing protein [Pyrinomonadaceae bacterium]
MIETRRISFLILVLLYVASTGIAQDDSRQKEAILNARKDAASAKAVREECDKMGWPESGQDNRCFEFYPNETIVWGKGFSDGLAKITVNGKAGFIDGSGKIVIRPLLSDAGYFSEGHAPFESSNGKWGFIDKLGNVSIRPQFDWALSFREGLAAVQVGKNWGYVDRSGRLVIDAKFETASSFSEGLAVVTWYDENLKTESDPKGKWQNNFIDSNGKAKYTDAFESISRGFNDGIALVNRSVKCAYPACSETYAIDKSGVRLWLLDSWYTSPFVDDAVTVARGVDIEGHDVYTVLGRDGKQLFEETFSQIGGFSDGLAPARKAWVGKYGFIDKRGEFVIEQKFDSASSFSEGLAAVQIGSRYGYINRLGNLIVSPQFEYADQFQGGFALVAPSGRGKDTTGYIDRTGKYIWKPTK